MITELKLNNKYSIYTKSNIPDGKLLTNKKVIISSAMRYEEIKKVYTELYITAITNFFSPGGDSDEMDTYFKDAVFYKCEPIETNVTELYQDKTTFIVWDNAASKYGDEDILNTNIDKSQSSEIQSSFSVSGVFRIDENKNLSISESDINNLFYKFVSELPSGIDYISDYGLSYVKKSINTLTPEEERDEYQIKLNEFINASNAVITMKNAAQNISNTFVNSNVSDKINDIVDNLSTIDAQLNRIIASLR